jgi:transposase
VSGCHCSGPRRRTTSLLNKLKGVGPSFATVLTREVFYRRFANRREVGSYVGLAPTPFNSGAMR